MSAPFDKTIPATEAAALTEIFEINKELGHAASLVNPELHLKARRTSYLLGLLDEAVRGMTWPSPKDKETATPVLHELQACETVLLCDFIERTGGGFFHDLSRALRRADPSNRRTLYRAFSLPLYTYLKDQRAWAAQSGGDPA